MRFLRFIDLMIGGVNFRRPPDPEHPFRARSTFFAADLDRWLRRWRRGR